MPKSWQMLHSPAQHAVASLLLRKPGAKRRQPSAKHTLLFHPF
jgi:hypothetical protein